MTPSPAPQVPAVATAKRGDPLNASRGAAVLRAKRVLGDSIDDVLGLVECDEPDANADAESAEIAVLACVLGLSADQTRARLSVATLGELRAWTEAVQLQSPGQAKGAA